MQACPQWDGWSQALAMAATFCSPASCLRCSPRACAMSAGSRSLWADARVLEQLVAGVVAGDERDPRAAMASRAAEVEPADRDRQVEEPLRPRTIGPHQIRMQQTVAEIAGRRAEHGVHVIRREGDVPDLDVAKVRREPSDLVDDLLRHLVLELACVAAVLDR